MIQFINTFVGDNKMRSLKKELIILSLSLVIFSSLTFSKDSVDNEVDKEADEEVEEEVEDEELSYKRDKCLECHFFTEKELMSQIKRARNRHIKAQKNQTSCAECHDKDEVVGICCHAYYPK